MFISGIRPYNFNSQGTYTHNNATRPTEPACDTVSFGNTKKDSQYEKLERAIYHEDTKTFKSVLNSANEETKQQMLLQTDTYGYNLLMKSVFGKNTETVEVILNAADEKTKQQMLPQTDIYGRNALMYATAFKNNPETAEIILNAADEKTKQQLLLQTDKKGFSASKLAEKYENFETAEMLRNSEYQAITKQIEEHVNSVLELAEISENPEIYEIIFDAADEIKQKILQKTDANDDNTADETECSENSETNEDIHITTDTEKQQEKLSCKMVRAIIKHLN